jgi:putative peptidoglycan lipid II flippase
MAAISIAVNIVLGILLMGPLKHGGLALATSLASMVNLGLLIRVLAKRLGPIKWGSIGVSTVRTIVSSGIMGGAVWIGGRLVIPAEESSAVALLAGLMGTILAGIALYATSAYILKSAELKEVLTTFRKSSRE